MDEILRERDKGKSHGKKKLYICIKVKVKGKFVLVF